MGSESISNPQEDTAQCICPRTIPEVMGPVPKDFTLLISPGHNNFSFNALHTMPLSTHS